MVLAKSYPLIRPLLFQLPPEAVHRVALSAARLLHRRQISIGSRKIMGIAFPNPIGVAAGLDKNADYLDQLGRIGFGFIEVGTVTPKPQPGNPKPRLFRITRASALINRLGFNNKGVDHLVGRLRKTRYRGVIGVNIGKNLSTDLDHADDDYLYCLRAVYPYASYVTINISSPNTPGLRDLQHGSALNRLLAKLKSTQADLAAEFDRYVPLALKIAPDLSSAQIDELADNVIHNELDAVIATNTTNHRTGVANLPYADESGGLSGAPLTDYANTVTEQLHRRLANRIPIIGVGGIMCGADAQARLAAGASLIQIYTGLIYRGPALVDEIAMFLSTTESTPAIHSDPDSRT